MAEKSPGSAPPAALPSETSDNPSGYLEVGDAYFHEGDYNRAIRVYRRGLKHAPRDFRLYLMLAEASGRKGWTITARTLYCRAFTLDAQGCRQLQRELALSRPEHRTKPDLPKSVFVLGSGHSGTTILTRLLASHSSLMHAQQGETHAFLEPEAQLSNALERWDANCRDHKKVGWVEKSVSHCYQVPRMLSHRPDAKFVIILRDGRDVVCSMKTRKYGYRNFDELVRQWVCVNRTILYYRDTPGFHVVHYEQLVREPGKTLRDICALINERFEESMLDYHLTEISWNTISGAAKSTRLTGHNDHQRLRHWQVNQPLFDGTRRWQREMNEDEKQLFKALAGDELEEWGFADRGDW